MRNKHLLLLVAGVLVTLALIFTFSGSFRNQTAVQPASEPETGGGTSVSISNTEKLNSLLSPAEFFAAKDALGIYIQGRFGEDTTATIKDTNLGSDGSIRLWVDVVDKEFTAYLYQKNGGFYFEVPADKYQTHRSQMEVNDQYQGILNE